MPRPNDSPDVAASKTLAYILRHGAEKEGLDIRSDGYIKLSDVLARPKMRGIDVEMVLRLVAENAKQRFELFYGYDPSPPKPRGKGKGKGKADGRRGGKGMKPEMNMRTSSDPRGTFEAVAAASNSLAASETLDSRATNELLPPGSSGSGPLPGVTKEVDAAIVDDLQSALTRTALEDAQTAELPLVSLPMPTAISDTAPEATLSSTNPQGEYRSTIPQGEGPSANPHGEYFIRATQGHSLKLESVSHLTPVLLDEDGRKRAGEMVHGTRWELWETIKSSGLSRMARQHIHLAPTLDPTQHRITPRPNATLYIYLDLDALIAAGVPVYTSSNGVVLTPGDGDGRVGKEFWRRVERKITTRVPRSTLTVFAQEHGSELEQEERADKDGKGGRDGKNSNDASDLEVRNERVVIWKDGKDALDV